MRTTPDNYGRILHQLSHIVALNRRGKTDAAIDHIILTAFTVLKDVAPRSAREVANLVQRQYSITVREAAAQSSLDRLVSAGKLQHDPKSQVFHISAVSKAKIERQIADAQALERTVKDQWFEMVSQTHPDLVATAREELWSCLCAYQSKAFRRHGVETTRLLDPTAPNSDTDHSSLSSLLEEAVRETCHTLSPEIASSEVRRFFGTSTPERSRYIAQLLDATFTCFAISVDKATSAYLHQSIPRLMAFLDTNFIFGTLGINDNRLTLLAEEVVKLVREHKLPVELYYHTATFDEANRTLPLIAERIRRQRQWQPQVSRAALRSKDLSGLERRFHEQNVKSPVLSDAFLSRYDHLDQLLADQGFRLYTELEQNETQMRERAQLVMQYEEYLARRNRPKEYETRNHDIELWQTAYRLHNKRAPSPLHAGAVFLTCDRNFHTFAATHLRKQGDVNVVVLPNHLLQLLRPFLPQDAELDQHFVQSFALPEFRTAGLADEKTQAMVLNFLNAYDGITEERAATILARELAISKHDNKPRDPKEIEASIYREIAGQLEATAQRAEEMKQALERQSETMEALRADQERRDEEAAARLRAFQEQSREAFASLAQKQEEREQRYQEQERARLARIEALEAEKERETTRAIYVEKGMQALKARIRLGLAALVGIVGIPVLYFLPWWTRWSWFLDHPNGWGLYIPFYLMLAAVCCLVALPARRWEIFATIMVTALLSFVPLAGPLRLKEPSPPIPPKPVEGKRPLPPKEGAKVPTAVR